MKKNILLILSIVSINLFAQKNQNSFNLELFNEPTNNSIEFFNKQNAEKALNAKNKNLNANKTNVLLQKMDSTKSWMLNLPGYQFNINRAKTLQFLYDANNNLTSKLDLMWNASNTWENYIKYTYTYDSNNNQTSDFRQGWYWTGSTFAWGAPSKFSYTYDSNNNQTSNLQQNWNSSSLAWENVYKYSYTYDSNNNQTSSFEQNWNSSSLVWENKYQKTWTYYPTNKIKTYLYEAWTGSGWYSSVIAKHTYSYDSNNNMIYDSIFGWNTTTLAWDIGRRYTNTFDANNNLISSVYQGWNSLSLTWYNITKETYTYDANNNQISYLSQNTDIGGAWQNILKTKYTYDVNNFYTSLSFYQYNAGSVYVGDSTYYYFHTTVGINELQSKEKFITIYPNPSKDIFNLKTDKAITSIEVYNNIGILVSKPELKSNNQIDLSSLSKGLYFLKLFAGQQHCTEKVMIE
ncbi:MAG: T9SS type A sorting domain-containing protein [Bacteroidia bacterium]|nr:T9SS type A sorting domain-containing protein [Bacteroidia bacterium]